MESKHSLRKEVAANLVESMGNGGSAAVFFLGIAQQSPSAAEERRIACTILIPIIRQARTCRAFRFGNAELDASVRDVLLFAQNRQETVRLDVPDDCLLDLLVGRRAKRPTLVWGLSTRDEHFKRFLDGVFDPHILTNPRTVSGEAAIRFAQRQATLNSERAWFVLPSNKNLSGCLLYFQKSRATEMFTMLLEHVRFSEQYIRMFCS